MRDADSADCLFVGRGRRLGRRAREHVRPPSPVRDRAYASPALTRNPDAQRRSGRPPAPPPPVRGVRRRRALPETQGDWEEPREGGHGGKGRGRRRNAPRRVSHPGWAPLPPPCEDVGRTLGLLCGRTLDSAAGAAPGYPRRGVRPSPALPPLAAPAPQVLPARARAGARPARAREGGGGPGAGGAEIRGRGLGPGARRRRRPPCYSTRPARPGRAERRERDDWTSDTGRARLLRSVLMMCRE